MIDPVFIAYVPAFCVLLAAGVTLGWLLRGPHIVHSEPPKRDPNDESMAEYRNALAKAYFDGWTAARIQLLTAEDEPSTPPPTKATEV